MTVFYVNYYLLCLPLKLTKRCAKDLFMAKSEYIGFRTTKEIRQLLEELAEQGYRTLSQQCEMAIIEWLKANGYLNKKPKK